MPRKKEGLGPAFSCRLRADQDKMLRAEAKKKGLPLVTVLRLWFDDLFGTTSTTSEPQEVTNG